MSPATDETVGAVSSRNRLSGLTFIAAGALAVFYLVSSLYIGSLRVFWWDELVTVHIARLPDFKTIWTALGHGVDSQPPFYYLLVRWFGDVFGPGEVAARLPSSIGMTAGLLLIFDCVRRVTDGWSGLIAMSVATCSFLPYYGYEARPYGVFFMLAALLLWLWLCTPDNRISAAVLFGIVAALGVSMHYYFVLCLTPYALWELLYGKRGRLASPKLIAGIIGGAVTAAALSPLILSFSNNFGAGFWNRPSFGALKGIYAQLFPDGLFLLAIIAIWMVLADSQKDNIILPAMQPGEAVGWLFLCIPLAGFVVAEWKTNAFYGRYFIGVLPGVAVAFAYWSWRHFRNAALVSGGIFVLLAGWGIAEEWFVVRFPQSVEATGVREFLDLQGPLAIDEKKYLVFSSPLLFIDAQYYSDHPEQCILLLASGNNTDADSRRVTADSGPDAATLRLLAHELGLLSPYYPLQFWRIEDVRSHAPEVALIAPTQETLQEMKGAGLGFENRSSKSLTVIYPRR